MFQAMGGCRSMVARGTSAVAHWREAQASDGRLMRAVAQRDVAAFETLVVRHLPSIYRLCLRLLGDRHDAEDLTQDSFLRLWQSAPGWRPTGGGLPAWLHRVAANLCIDRIRARRPGVGLVVPELADQRADAVRRIEANELERAVALCLGRLPGHHRVALELSYFEGCSNALAAQLLDMKVKAFESLLLRARRRMGAELRLAGVRSEDIAVLA